MSSKYLFFPLFLFFSIQLFSQSWNELIYDTNATFFDVQKAFYTEWEDKPYEKGKGYKQFKRWEHFMQSRVNENGKLDQSWIKNYYKKQTSSVSVLPSFNNQNSTSSSWELVGPITVPERNVYFGGRKGIGRVNCIVFDPSNNNILYVGTPAGGIWKSIDGGQNWTTNTQFLNSLGVSCLAIDPNNSNIIYAGTGDKDGSHTYTIGLLKSIDAGQTWQSIGLNDQLFIKDVIINPTNSQNILVSTQYGVWRTVDGGTNWSAANGIASNINDISFKPENYDIVYATRNYGSVFYKSNDNGANWSLVTNGLPTSYSANRGVISVSPNNPNVVYVAFTDNSEGFYGIYKSINSGYSFTEQYRCITPSSSTPNLLTHSATGDASGGQGFYDFAIATNPTNSDEIYIGGVNIWKSSDGGQSWSINTHWFNSSGAYSQVHADQHALEFQPNTANLYSCHDGGLSVTTDNGSSWNDLSDGLSITQYYDLGVSFSDTDLVIMGAQDNGTFLRDSSSFEGVLGGDGMQCFIDFEDENIMYAEYQYGDIQRSTDGGATWTNIKPFVQSGNGAWETPFTYDKTNASTIYVGYSQLFKSTDRGDSWTSIASTSLTENTNISTIETTSDPDILYFGVYISSTNNAQPKIYKTINGGASWTDIAPNTGLLQRFNDIAVSENNPNHIWVCQSNKVWESKDGGENWADISSSYAGPHINSILHSRDNKSIFLATDKGVYKSNDSIISWSSFNNNSLPNVIVRRLEIQPITNTLNAASYGRGLWNIKLPIVVPPTCDFELESDTFSCDGIVEFKDLSSRFPASWQWDFGDGNSSSLKNPTHIYTSAGQYSVTLTVSNAVGSDTKTISNIINVMDQNIDVQGDSICQNTTAILTANSSYNVKWYSDALAQNQLASGNSFTTPILSNSTSYYVQSATTLYPEINSGIDKDITINTVNYWDHLGLTFNCHVSSILKSVKVYNLIEAERRIQLHDANGFILEDTTILMSANPNGEIITLNFDLPAQDGLSLREVNNSSTFGFLTCNENVTFPININNQVTIINDIFGFGIYAYFYDWIIQRKNCKSNITQVDVTVNPAISENITSSICNGDSFYLGGNNYSSTGVYTDTLSSVGGCDSIVYLNLNVLNVTTSSTNQTACNVYIWNGSTYNTSGTYTYTTTNSNGCDSIATLNLTINQPAGSSTSQTACSDYTWNGTNYNTSGSYTYTTTNAWGCDSMATLNLTINQPTSSSIFQTACNDYTWNGTTYNTSGTYTYTTTNAWGCDSTATLNLTIQNNTTWDTISSCNSYSWNGTNYTSSGIYSEVLPCGTSTLYLTINSSSNSFLSFSSCNSYTWNGTTYNTSGNYTFTTTNALGCDSTATLNLTINQSTSSSTSQTACSNYTWNGTTYNASGTYTHTTTNSNGCDSVANLNLTINLTTSSNSNIITCDSTYTWNGEIYSNSGIYTFNTQNSNSCDSIAKLNLTMIEISAPLINGTTDVNQNDDYNYNVSQQLSTNTIQWGIINGTINTGQYSNSVNVSWGNVSNLGTIWAIESDTNGCQSDTVKLIVNIDSTVTIIENTPLKINVYPNPFDNFTIVEFDNLQHNNYLIRLVDIRGRLIETYKVDGKRLQIYKKQLNNGIYFLEVEGKQKAREKVIIY